MFGAAMLSRQVYEQIRDDPRGPFQAGLAVLLVSLVAAFTAFGDGPAAIGVSLFIGIAFWLMLSLGIHFIGTGLLREPTSGATVREVLAVAGFAQSPGVLLFLALLPGIGTGAAFAIGLWQLWAAVGATQVAFGFRRPFRAASVVFLVWLPVQVIFALAAGQLDLGSTAA